MNLAYIRVSTAEQNEARQVEAMKQFQIEKWYIEKVSGKNTNRPKLQEMLDFCREGDTIHIHDFNRLARSTKDLLDIVDTLTAKGVYLVSNKENIDTSTPTGKLMLTMIAAINEFERTNLLERQREGIAIYVNRFMARQKAKRRKENTIKSYQDYIDCHIKPKLGSIPTAELTLDCLEKFYAEYLKTHAVSSARKVHVVISGAIKEAVRDGIFQYNFAEQVEFPTSHKYAGAAVYNQTEVDKLLQAAKEAGEPIRAAVTLAVCYGLRRSEVIGLRWKDIDFEGNSLTVSNTVVQNGELKIETELTKTKAGNRSIALLPVTVPYLKELKEKQEAAKLKTDKVVAWMDGQEVRPDFISRKTGQLMKKCGLPVIRFHDLRHTAASLLAPHVTPEQLRDFLGHEHISTTYDVYTHVLSDQKKATSAAMNDVLKNVSIM